ncbi:hypothetical protein H0251_19030 [Pectobacterium carotovorum]|uniref:hypothetical protein n=1 Tax=Pectobacterium carotovorum TaxID=554 RepID=UPI0015DE5464|nr:hypothetical protein [Pectobacterium carotovorum]MBA0181713.1 hypothetical protein [Pectobacterium carotovorum]
MRNKKPIFEPKLESTSFQTKDDVYEYANAFLDCARFSIEKSALDNIALINSSLVNASLSLEIYLKSLFLKREPHPYTLSKEDMDDISVCLDTERSRTQGIEATLWHSRLILDKEKQTHSLYVLFTSSPKSFKYDVYNGILNQEKLKKLFKDNNDIDNFLKKISDSFVEKRYAFEDFFVSDLGDYNNARNLIEVIDSIVPIIIKFNQKK